MFLQSLFIILLCALSSPYSHAFSTSHPTDDRWFKLLHIRSSDSISSQVTDPRFFLAPRDSHWTPQLELAATIAAITNTSDPFLENEHPVCRFPARIKYLVEMGLVSDQNVTRAHCPLFEIYKKTTPSKKVSYVFSSYFLGSPGSAFGHTFFRIHTEDHSSGQSSELLDRGIGYAATVEGASGLAYVFKGIFGGFKGEFTNLPYYYKVREYNDFEARDIWDYELNLTPSEVDYLTLHLWELGNSHFNYYFFTQNCAYHLLTSLEAAAPRLDLVRQAKPWMIPADSVKIIERTPGLVNQIRYRPALHSKAYHQYYQLNQDQQKVFRSFLRASESHEELPTHSLNLEQTTQTLDALLDYVDSLNPAGDPTKTAPHVKLRQSLLKQRAVLSGPKSFDKIAPPEEKAPHLSHESSRFSLGLTRFGSLNFIDFQYRFAIHDLLDNPVGYPPFSELELGRVNLALSEKGHVRMPHFRILGIQNFQPITDLDRPLSWNMAIDIFDPSLLEHYRPQIKGHIGYSAEWLHHLFYLQIGGQSNANPEKLVPQLRYGIVLNHSPALLRYHLELISSPDDALAYNLEARSQLTEKLDIGLTFSSQEHSSIRLLYFF